MSRSSSFAKRFRTCRFRSAKRLNLTSQYFLIMVGYQPSHFEETVLTTILFLLASATLVAEAQAGSWSQPSELSSAAEEIGGPMIGQGPNGYAVVLWSPGLGVTPRGDTPSNPVSPGRVSVRVRKSWGQPFGPVKSFGILGAQWGTVAVGERGHTVVAWRDADGKMWSSFRGLKKNWSAPKLVSEHPFMGLHLDVAPDGTSVAAGSIRLGSKDVVFAATKGPGMNRFGKLRRINRGPGTMGNYMAVAASTRGRASVAWGGICPLFDPAAREPVRVAESGRKGRFSLPRTVPGTKCPSSGIDIQSDSGGKSYLLVNGSLSDRQNVRISTRHARKWFGPARVLNTKQSSAVEGVLTLSGSGTATVIWQDLRPRTGGVQPPVSYSYSRATRRTGFSPARKLPLEVKDHYLIGAAATSGKRVVVLWQNLADLSLISSTIGEKSMTPTRFVAQPPGKGSLATGSIVGRSDGATAIWSEKDRASSNLMDLGVAACKGC